MAREANGSQEIGKRDNHVLITTQVGGERGKRRTICLNGDWECHDTCFDTPPEELPGQFYNSIPVPGLWDMAKTPFSFTSDTEILKSGKYEKKALWYKKQICFEGNVPENVILKIHKAFYGVTIYVNGRYVTLHQPNFTPCYVHLEKYLKGNGAVNTILIKTGDKKAQPDDWGNPTGYDAEKQKYVPGIYDDVSLILSANPYIAYIQAEADLQNACLKAHATLVNHSDEDLTADVKFTVRESFSQNQVAQKKLRQITVPANRTVFVEECLQMGEFHPWSPESPFLYELDVETDGDQFMQKFGMRDFHYDREHMRAVLNGYPYYLRGTNVCMFRFFEDPQRGDLPWDREWAWKVLSRFKGLNLNSLRFSIGFPPDLWYDLCDEIGILVDDEYPIWGEYECKTNLNNPDFIGEVVDWVRERANHASVVQWDIQNETFSVPKDSFVPNTADVIRIIRDRGVDFSNRPWDNGWMPPESGEDSLECHPYLFLDPKYQLSYLNFTNQDPATIYGQYFNDEQSTDPALIPPNPRVINEYSWLWISRNGKPTTLTEALYHNLFPNGYTERQLRDYYAKGVAELTEFWRDGRKAAGVMEFCGLTYSRENGQTSDNFLPDIRDPHYDPLFQKLVSDAFASVGIVIEDWSEYHPVGMVHTFPVAVLNDLSCPWAGEVTVSLYQDGKRISDFKKTYSVEPAGKAVQLFPVPIPDNPTAAFKLVASYENGRQQIIQSIREFRDGKELPLIHEINWTFHGEKKRADGCGTMLQIGQQAMAGEKIEAKIAAKDFSENYNYVVVDWGDGSWSYNGPFLPDVSGSVSHVYRAAGTYQVKALCKNMEYGEGAGWSDAVTVSVSGNASGPSRLRDVLAVSSSEYDVAHQAHNVLDGSRTTSWKSEAAGDLFGENWVGLLFDRSYRLDAVEIEIPETSSVFPANFALEYTTDRGASWQPFPKYSYQFEYSKSWYTPVMAFPDPKGFTLDLPLDSIVANGIRIISKLYGFDQIGLEKTLEISQIRVSGDESLLFYTSKGGVFDADLNNMWTIYGSALSEPTVTGSKAGPNPDPFRSGCATIPSTEWLEWDGMKHLWRADFNDIQDLYDKALFKAYAGPDGHGNDGYIWATTDGRQHLGHENHYTYNAIFIIAARNYLFYSNHTDGFMERRNAHGQSMEERIRQAMKYMLQVQGGETGVLTITDPENNGMPGSNSSNYWDSITAFGNISSYENILFYNSLLAMADLGHYTGDAEKEKEFRMLADKARTRFNQVFWDQEKGRYITSIDQEGNRLDFGITFVNMMAVSSGLATSEQARKIYDWLDGNRVISGDTSVQADIYAFRMSARANTLDISRIGPPYYWWNHDGLMPCTKDTMGGYGNQMQNGGTIFYTSYFDMLARLRFFGADNAFRLFNTIFSEFHKDSLRRFPYTVYGGYVAGIIGEFPESGLVPLTFLNGFLGMEVSAEGLCVNPHLPSGMEFAGVSSYVFGSRTYSIRVSQACKTPTIESRGERWQIELPAEGGWIITRDSRIISSCNN